MSEGNSKTGSPADQIAKFFATARERVAKAMYEASVKAVQEASAKLDLSPQRIKKVFDAARKEADRSAAIMMFALAEDLMIGAIERYCETKLPGKQGWDAVKSAHGLLGNASDRMTFLYILRWIEPRTHADFDLMRKIRNRFAHHADVEGFGSDNEIRGYLSSMGQSEKELLKDFPSEKVKRREELSPRELYLIRSAFTVVMLVRDLAMFPSARANQVSPHDVINYGAMPQNFRELSDVLAEHFIEIVKKDAVSTPASERPD
jgi:hypothetical protein